MVEVLMLMLALVLVLVLVLLAAEEPTEELLVIVAAVCNAAQVSFRSPESPSPPN